MGYQVVEVKFDEESGKFTFASAYGVAHESYEAAEEDFIETFQDFKYDCWGLVNTDTGVLEEVDSSIVGMDKCDQAYGIEMGQYSFTKADVIETLISTLPGRKVWDSNED